MRPPSAGRPSPARWSRAAWTAAWLALLPLAVARAGVLGEADTFWEIRTGELILDSGRIPGTDPFSWTAYGRPWHPNSWAFDVLLAVVYRPGGLAAVALFGAGLVMVIVGVMLLLAQRLGAGPAGSAVLILVAAPLLVGWFAVRPQLADYIAVPVLLLLLEVLSSGERIPATLVAIAVLQAAWVNLHAAATLGVVLVVAAGAVSVAVAWRRGGPGRVATRFAAGVLAAAAGTLANPAGWDVVIQGWRVHNASTGLIVEWKPLNVADPMQDMILLAGASALLVAAAWRWWRAAAFLAVLAIGAVTAARFQPILLVCAVPVLAASLAPVPAAGLATGFAARLAASAARRWTATWPGLPWVTAAMLAVAWSVPAGAALPHLGRPLLPVGPVHALPRGCRLVNLDQIGGLVILLRPDIAVSVDSRNDVYGRADALRLKHLVDDDSEGPQRLAELGVTCALVPAHSGLARRLAAEPQWRKIVEERGQSLFVRQSG